MARFKYKFRTVSDYNQKFIGSSTEDFNRNKVMEVVGCFFWTIVVLVVLIVTMSLVSLLK